MYPIPKNLKGIVEDRLNEVIKANSNHSKTANHFYRLKRRMLRNMPLTQKMQDNLSWVLKDIQNRKNFLK